VENVFLSRWKGGGFGMYSEIHPSERVIVAGFKQPDNTYVIEKVAYRYGLLPIKYYPHDKNLDDLIRKINPDPSKKTTVEIWQPKIITHDRNFYFLFDKILQYEN
jgi:hypothetical protein